MHTGTVRLDVFRPAAIGVGACIIAVLTADGELSVRAGAAPCALRHIDAAWRVLSAIADSNRVNAALASALTPTDE